MSNCLFKEVRVRFGFHAMKTTWWPAKATAEAASAWSQPWLHELYKHSTSWIDRYADL